MEGKIDAVSQIFGILRLKELNTPRPLEGQPGLEGRSKWGELAGLGIHSCDAVTVASRAMWLFLV